MSLHQILEIVVSIIFVSPFLALKEKKIVYRSLDSFTVDYEVNKIKLFIGKGNDEAIVKPLFNMVKKSFQNLGIDFVDFEVVIDSLILPIEDNIKISKEEDVMVATEISKKPEKVFQDKARNRSCC